MSTADDAPAVALRGLVKTFRMRGVDPVLAVNGVDLTVERGEIVALLGPNGAGKTTALDMILGLTEPTSGEARVLGQGPRAAVEAGRISAVLQTGGLLADLTVRETVRMIGSLFARPAGTDEVIARAGLTEIAGRRVSKCSGGEQQRLRFALALLSDPDLLVLDEPTSGMDVVARRGFWDTMRAEAATGRTVIFATHYLEEADAFAERIVLIARGQIVADGSTDDIRTRSTGRSVSADVDDADGIQDRLRALPGVSGVSYAGRRVTVAATAAASDDVARALLGHLGGSNVEISSGSLESAFVALTYGGDLGSPSAGVQA